MKKILCSLITGLLLQSCTSSPEDRAKELIKNHLYETLNDDKSYESVSYGELDSIYTSIKDDSIYRRSNLQYDIFYSLFQSNEKFYHEYKHDDYMVSYCDNLVDEMHIYLDSMKFYAAIKDSIEKSFNPEFKGYAITHRFRANNALGNKILSLYVFYFDKDITKIVRTVDSDNIK